MIRQMKMSLRFRKKEDTKKQNDEAETAYRKSINHQTVGSLYTKTAPASMLNVQNRRKTTMVMLIAITIMEFSIQPSHCIQPGRPFNFKSSYKPLRFG